MKLNDGGGKNVRTVIAGELKTWYCDVDVDDVDDVGERMKRLCQEYLNMVDLKWKARRAKIWTPTIERTTHR